MILSNSDDDCRYIYNLNISFRVCFNYNAFNYTFYNKVHSLYTYIKKVMSQYYI